jgi:hypothetical protein
VNPSQLHPDVRVSDESQLLPPLFTAAFLRLALIFAGYSLTGTMVMMQGDTASYLEPGRNLLLHGAFFTAGHPEIDRTPGYPIFAMLTGMFFNDVLCSVIVQTIVSLLSLCLVHRIAANVFPDSRAAYIAAWLFALEPLSVLYTARLMPETLFTLFLLLTIERVLTFQRTGRLSSVALAAISLTLATFVRPVTYYLGFALAVALAFTSGKEWRFRWQAPMVLLLFIVPALAAWQVRNYVETGYGGFSSIVEKNLYFFQSAEVTAELEHEGLKARQNQLGYLDQADYIAAHPEQAQWTQSQRLHFMRTRSAEILKANAGLYLKTHFTGVGIVAFTPAASELMQLLDTYPKGDSMPQRILNEGILSSFQSVLLAHPLLICVMLLLEVFLLALYVFAVRGICNSAARPLAVLTLVSFALYFLLISGGAQAVGRYRMPIMPILCILAAGGLSSLRTKKMRGQSSPASALVTL